MTYARVSGRNPKPPKRYEEKEKKRKRHKSSSAKSVKDSDRYLIVNLKILCRKFSSIQILSDRDSLWKIELSGLEIWVCSKFSDQIDFLSLKCFGTKYFGQDLLDI